MALDILVHACMHESSKSSENDFNVRYQAKWSGKIEIVRKKRLNFGIEIRRYYIIATE